MLWWPGKPPALLDQVCYVLRDLNQAVLRLSSLFLGEEWYRFVDDKGHSGFGFGNKLTVGGRQPESEAELQLIVVT